MKASLSDAMSRALEATRSGRLAEATHAIQAALRGEAPQDAAESAAHQGTAHHGAAEAGARRPSLAEPRPATRPAPHARAGAPDPGRTRRPLKETLKDLIDLKALQEGLRGAARPAPASAPDLPGGTRYSRHRHQCAFGARGYTLFVPSAREEPVRGLVMMLHGCTQNADDFAAGTRMNAAAEAANLIVVYPEQDRGSNNMGCWNWFEPANQSREAGEPALLADLARAVGAEFGVPPGRAFVAGLSAGGAMAAILAQTHGDVFAAAGVHSGLPRGAARDVASAFGAMRSGARGAALGPSVPVILFHGTADTTVAPANAEGILAAAAGQGATEIEEPAGKGIRRRLWRGPDGRPRAEDWRLEGVGHAWSGGAPEGSYTHPGGPDATTEMLRFFAAVSGH